MPCWSADNWSCAQSSGKSPLLDDDLALSGRAALGDQAAFAVLVARHEGRLRAFLARLAGRDQADELAQETFLRAWLQAGRFDGRGNYGGWLYRIAWNLFLDARRTERRRILRETGVKDQPATEASSIESALDAQKLLMMLDERTRAALVLCDGHGWSHSEAAAILGLPLGTLKSLVARGKARLRTELNYRGPA